MKKISITDLVTKVFFVFALAIVLYSCRSSRLGKIPPPSPDSRYANMLSTRDHLLDSAVANEWIQRFLQYKNRISNNSVGNSDSVLCNSEAFNKQLFLKFFEMPNCIGIRISYGMDDTLKIHQIITGVNQSGYDLYIHAEPPPPDLLPGKGGRFFATKTYAGENGQGCPVTCNP